MLPERTGRPGCEVKVTATGWDHNTVTLPDGKTIRGQVVYMQPRHLTTQQINQDLKSWGS
jgi:hypothetical protein